MTRFWYAATVHAFGKSPFTAWLRPFPRSPVSSESSLTGEHYGDRRDQWEHRGGARAQRCVVSAMRSVTIRRTVVRLRRTAAGSYPGRFTVSSSGKCSLAIIRSTPAGTRPGVASETPTMTAKVTGTMAMVGCASNAPHHPVDGP